MSIEEDTLKTLNRIEKLLANSVSSSSRGRIAGGAGGAADDDKEKTFKAVAASMDSLSDAADGLGKSFTKLNKTIMATRAGFVSMNRNMRGPRPVAPTITNIVQQTAAPITMRQNPFATLLGGVGGGNVSRNVRALTGSLSFATVALANFVGQLGAAIRPVVNDFFSLHARGIEASSSLGGLYIDAARAGMSLQEYTEVLETSNVALTRASNFDDFNRTLRTSNDQLAGLGVFGKAATQLSATLATSTTALGIPQAQLGNAMSQQVNVFEQLRKTTLLTADGFRSIIDELSNNQEVQSQLLGLSGQERQARFQELTQIRTLGLQMGATESASRALGQALLDQRKLTAQQRFQSAGTIRQAGAIAGLNAGDSETLARLSRTKNRTADENALFTQLGGQLQANIERMMNSGNVQQEYIAEQLQERLNSSGIGTQLQAAGNVALTSQSGPAGVNREFAKGAGDLVQGAGKLLTLANGLSANPIAEALTKAIGSSAFTLGLGAVIGRVMGRLPIFGGLGGAASGLVGGIGSALSTATATVKNGIGGILNLITKPFTIGPGTGIIKDLQAVWGTVRAGWTTFVDGISTFKGSASKITGIFSSIVDGAKTLFSTVRGLGGGLDILGIIGKATSAFGRLLKFIPAIGNILSFFVDSIGGVFTGKIAAAFNEDGGGWLDRIGNIVFAGINGIFGGIFGLVDDAIKFFGGEKLGLENAWDKFAVVMRAGFFSALASIAEAVTFGKENKVSSYFREAADNSFKVLNQLSDDQSATITSIGEKNNKKLDEQKAAADKSTAAVKATTTAVQAGAGLLTTTENLAASLVSTANTVAVPAIQQRPSVTQTDVNNQQTTAASVTAAAPGTQPAATPATAVTDQLTTQFAQIIQLLRDSLDAERLQASLTESLVRSTGRPVFTDTTRMIDRVAAARTSS